MPSLHKSLKFKSLFQTKITNCTPQTKFLATQLPLCNFNQTLNITCFEMKCAIYWVLLILLHLLAFVFFYMRNHGHCNPKYKDSLFFLEKTSIFIFFIADCNSNETWGPVLHYQFTSWPDFGVANSCISVISLVRNVRGKLGTNASKETVPKPLSFHQWLYCNSLQSVLVCLYQLCNSLVYPKEKPSKGLVDLKNWNIR